MSYKLYCSQRKDYGWSGKMKTIKEWKDILIDFHSVDVDENYLKKLNINQLLLYYEWELHDINGKFVYVKERINESKRI